MLNFPLELRFRHLSFSPQIVVTDATGQEVCFVKQKAFRLKESVALFKDSSQKTPLGTIEANRIIDWSARYTFKDADGKPFGAVGRQGARSLWRLQYDIFSESASNTVSLTIQEESVMTRFLDGILAGIPVIGLLSGYFFHPSYAVRRPDGTVVARLRKRPALLEGRFSIERVGEVSQEEALEITLSCLMMTLLERRRG